VTSCDREKVLQGVDNSEKGPRLCEELLATLSKKRYGASRPGKNLGKGCGEAKKRKGLTKNNPQRGDSRAQTGSGNL